MAKLKARATRKKTAIKKSNVERSNSKEWQPSFTGCMRISLKAETDDATIMANVIRRKDWLRKSYDIFKRERQFLINIVLYKFDKSIEPAEIEVLTDAMDRVYIYDVAKVFIRELEVEDDGVTPHEDIDYGASYAEIRA